MLTDEAHRSQYDTLALNMRSALPCALFIAFTGTPLLTGEERAAETAGLTRAEFLAELARRRVDVFAGDDRDLSVAADAVFLDLDRSESAK